MSEWEISDMPSLYSEYFHDSHRPSWTSVSRDHTL